MSGTGRHRWKACVGAATLIGLQPLWLAPAMAQVAANQDLPDKAIDLANKEADDESIFKFDFGVPSSPATTLLGMDTVTQSNSLKAFLVKLPDLVALREGGLSGAVEISPAALLTDVSRMTYKEFSAADSIFFRTRIGVALYQGMNDTDPAKQKASRAALGVSTSLFGYSDPLRARLPGSSKPALETCLQLTHAEVIKALPTLGHDPDIDRALTEWNAAIAANDPALIRIKAKALDDATAVATERMRAAWAKSTGHEIVETCKKVADRAARMATDFDIGGGALWEGDPGKLSGLKNPAATLWASFRTTIGGLREPGTSFAQLKSWADAKSPWFMLGGSGRVSFSEAIATGDAAKPKIRANTFTGWAGIEGYSETARFALQAGLQRTDPRDPADSRFRGNRFVYQLSLDYEVSDGLWLTGSLGKANGGGALKSDSKFNLSVTVDTPAIRKIFGR